jgi:hypothetical protein
MWLMPNFSGLACPRPWLATSNLDIWMYLSVIAARYLPLGIIPLGCLLFDIYLSVLYLFAAYYLPLGMGLSREFCCLSFYLISRF